MSGREHSNFSFPRPLRTCRYSSTICKRLYADRTIVAMRLQGYPPTDSLIRAARHKAKVGYKVPCSLERYPARSRSKRRDLLGTLILAASPQIRREFTNTS